MIVSILIYLVFCVFTVLVGLGVLTVLKLTALKHKALLAPIVTLAYWSVLLGITVIIGFPIKQSASYIWVSSFLLGLVGLIDLKRNITPFNKTIPLLVCLILPVAVAAAYFWDGRLFTYLAGNMPDGWSYIANGQYLWEHARGGTRGTLVPLYKYAANFSGARFITPALLALFSFIFEHGDTQASMGILHVWGIFIFATGLSFFSLRAFSNRVIAMIFTGTVIFSGWTFNLMWNDNLDQLITISFLPVLVVLFQLRKPDNLGLPVLSGLLIAASLYGYPEMSIFLLWSLMIVFGFRLIREREQFRYLSLFSFVTLTVVVVFLFPYLKEYFSFIIEQLKHTGDAVRPGEGMFGGLVNVYHEPAAFWGIGSEIGKLRFLLLQNIFGWLFSLLCLVGIIRLAIKKNALAIAWITTILAAFYMIIFQNYSYGAYKFILFSWWGLVYFVFIGIETLAQRADKIRFGRHTIIATSLVFIIAFSVSTGAHIFTSAKSFAMGKSIRTTDKLKQLKKIERKVGESTVALAVDDWFANEWAVYYLRDIRIDLAVTRAYMSGYLINDVKSYNIDSIKYVLTDNDSRYIEAMNPNFKQYFRIIWSNDLYKLWKVNKKNWFFLADIRADVNFFSDIERNEANWSFWLGKETRLRFLSSANREINLRGVFAPGPGDHNPEREVSIDGYVNYDNISFRKLEEKKLRLRLNKGKTDIVLRTIKPTKPTVFIRNDSRQLLVNFTNFTATNIIPK